VRAQFYTFDNKAIYAQFEHRAVDKSAIVVIEPETAKETQLVYENPEVDVDSLAFSKKRKVLTLPCSIPGNSSVISSILKRNPSTKRSLANCQDTNQCRRSR